MRRGCTVGVDGPPLAPDHRTRQRAQRRRSIGRPQRAARLDVQRQPRRTDVRLERPLVVVHRRAAVEPGARAQRRRERRRVGAAVLAVDRLAIVRIDATEAARRAERAVVVPVAIAVARRRAGAADPIALHPRVDDRPMRRHPRRPRRALGGVAQVVRRRRAPRQLGAAPAAIVDRDQRSGWRRWRERQVRQRVRATRPRRRPHQRGPTVAAQIRHRDVTPVDPRQAGHAPRGAEAAPAQVRVVPHAAVVEVQQIGTAAAAHVDQPHPPAVVAAHVREPRRRVHHYALAEPPVAERRPVLDRAAADAHQIGQPVARHVGEHQVQARIRSAQRRGIRVRGPPHLDRRLELVGRLVERA